MGGRVVYERVWNFSLGLAPGSYAGSLAPCRHPVGKGSLVLSLGVLQGHERVRQASQNCVVQGREKGNMCCRGKHRPVCMGQQRGVCMLTHVHETLVSVSLLVCYMFALSRLQGTECDGREGKPCPPSPLEVISVVLRT